MRLSAGSVANGLAWLVMAGLIVAAVLVTNRLGFAGLFGLGLVTWLICTRASLDQQVPTWGVGVFESVMTRPRSEEARAAADAEHQTTIAPFRFYGWCGAALAVIGGAGFVWELWRK